MKFAINYSPESLQIWQNNEIQVDLFKFPPWEELRPYMTLGPAAYVHFGNIAGGPYAVEHDHEILRMWLDTTDTLVVNTHLAISASDFGDGAPVTPEAVIRKAIKCVDRLGRHFGNDRVVVENPPFPLVQWDAGLLAEVVDPVVVGEIVRRSGCGLLLDVAHAIRSCEGTGRADVPAYLNAMPVDALARAARGRHLARQERIWRTRRSLRYDRRRLGRGRLGGGPDSRRSLARTRNHGI